MTVRSVVAVGVLAGMLRSADLKPVSSSKANKAFKAMTENGSVTLPIREVLLEGVYPSGKPAKGNLVVVFDPSTGWYLCSYAAMVYQSTPHKLGHGDLFLSKLAVTYSGQYRLVTFMALPDASAIMVLPAKDKARDMDDAENRALQEVVRELGAIERNPIDFGWQRVPLNKELGLPFVTPPHKPVNGPLELVQVRHESAGWDITLRGQWTASVVFDEEFKLREVKKVGR